MINRLRNAEGRFFWMTAAAIVLVALALIYGTVLQRTTSAESLPSTLRTTDVIRGDIEEIVRSPGEVTARTATLTFPASGVVNEVLARPGLVVSAGQPLARLDTREYEANLAAAIAAQKAAQAKLDAVQNSPAREIANLQQSLKTAQARVESLRNPSASREQLAAAQAAVDAAVYHYNSVVSTPSQKDVAAAEAGLRAAKARLAKLRAGPAETDKRAVQARIDSAQQNLEKVRIASANAIVQADLNLQKARTTKASAQASYNAVHAEVYNGDKPKETATPADIERDRQAKLALDQAILNEQSAQKALDGAKEQERANLREAQAVLIEAQVAKERLEAAPPQQDINNAQAEVDRAQALYDQVAAGPDKDAVNAAQAAINEARARLEALNKGADPKDIALAQAEVDRINQQIQTLTTRGAPPAELSQAQGELEQAQNMVKQAQIKLEQTNLLAPFNSVVESINLAPGQAVAPGLNHVSLVDLSNLGVEARVNENNIQRIKPGLPVRVFFEDISGVREEPFLGRVTFISYRPHSGSSITNTSPTLTTTPTPAVGPVSAAPPSGLATGYPVRIVLDPDPQLQSLKPGMTGRIRFVLERKTQVLLVPHQSIRNLPLGPVVDVMLPGGSIVTTPVTLGVASDDMAEVLDGGLLREGDKIIVHGDGPLPEQLTPTPSSSPNPGATPGTESTPGAIEPGTPGTQGATLATAVATQTADTGAPTATPIVLDVPGNTFSGAPRPTSTPRPLSTVRPGGVLSPPATAGGAVFPSGGGSLALPTTPTPAPR